MIKIYARLLLAALFLICFKGLSQTNYLQNASFESWSGSPESPENWSITNENDINKSSDATEGNFSLELDLNNTLANQTVLSTWNAGSIVLEPNANHTFTFDFNTDTAEDYAFELMFRANTDPASSIKVDNLQVLSPEAAVSPDRDALIALYNATDGPNWTNTWDLESDISTWYGVTLNNENRVEKLLLNNNKLTGTLINEIGNLTSLVELDLTLNSLSGEIPSQLFNLQIIRRIQLGYNNLSGSIPTTIENLSLITNLSLSNNDLSGSIPSSIGNLSTLTSLYLDGNDFNGEIPRELGNLSDLRSLSLSENQLSGTIPETFINLTQIRNLYLGYNNLSGEIPEFIWSLGSLRVLSASANNFSGQLTSAIANAENIESLYLDSNNFSGKLPIEIWSLPSLTNLNLEKLNSLDPWSLPSEIQNLTNLGTLNARSGNLTGELPNTFETLINLTSLYLDNNDISGQIPSSLGSLPNLSNLGLHRNNLSGALPEISSENATINIVYNNFVFEDIEDKINSYNYKNLIFHYYPQNYIDVRQEIIIPEGEEFQLTVNDTQSENNTYQWRLKEIAIPDATEATLDLLNFSDQDVGLYDCVITNPNVPGLTLYKNPILLATQFYLDNINKISVKSIGASCPNEAKGEIVVEFGFPQKYKINLRKENNKIGERISSNGETVSFTNLLAGDDYSIEVYSYISDNYNSLRTAGSFNIIVSEPEAFISGKAVIDQAKKTAKLVVSGSKNYEALVNETKMNFSFQDTGRHELRFDLTNGANSILVKTDKNCQGEYSETILVNSVRVFPNPSIDEVTILGVKNDEDALISILDMSGVLIKSYTKNLTDESVVINIANLPEGMYLIQVKSKEQDVQTKIIKR